MVESKRPFELLPIFRERVWGRRNLPSYFAHAPLKEPIGEVWFTFTENDTSLGKNLREILRADPSLLGEAAHAEYPGVCPLLVKLIFTSERLSVQVHPDDDYAARHHGCLGKTEAWYVMDSQPPGEVAIGFKEPLSAERFEGAVKSGEVENLLDWRKVRAGDVVFVPAGTVHAIGAGLTICEIQENSDITYRLYDYGRPRELHLEHGIKVSNLGPHKHKPAVAVIDATRTSLLQCDCFKIERLTPGPKLRIPSQPFYLLLICLKGQGTLNGEPFSPGRAWFVPAGGQSIDLNGAGSEWILTYTSKTGLKS